MLTNATAVEQSTSINTYNYYTIATLHHIYIILLILPFNQGEV